MTDYPPGGPPNLTPKTLYMEIPLEEFERLHARIRELEGRLPQDLTEAGMLAALRKCLEAHHTREGRHPTSCEVCIDAARS